MVLRRLCPPDGSIVFSALLCGVPIPDGWRFRDPPIAFSPSFCPQPPSSPLSPRERIGLLFEANESFRLPLVRILGVMAAFSLPPIPLFLPPHHLCCHFYPNNQKSQTTKDRGLVHLVQRFGPRNPLPPDLIRGSFFSADTVEKSDPIPPPLPHLVSLVLRFSPPTPFTLHLFPYLQMVRSQNFDCAKF